ncbi:MAG: Pyrroline-5-carboxylate reductase [uncultured Solirubrobacteraceae bacterium]|uniref:Pyrroline-5-carboxylate reductase n=1 Tax=uncultured Solirubrobacteraceae bacterium TaxID=1162706 RepID=A0A6J4SNR4_9ACTN|nr:MAG: Pyrroline-5-carboxylate reductase [uncultured Solirubrobacteraceae bacterium]
MTVGLVGAGNMARALARGWAEPILCTDGGSGRAAALADEVGGEALGSNAELARRADVVVLAHKPAQLESVAAGIAGAAAGKLVVSLLARVPRSAVAAAYPGSTVMRVQPNLAVERRCGVSALGFSEGDVASELAQTAQDLFARLGTVVVVSDHLLDVASACSGVGPAYWALVVEAQVDAAVRSGLTPAQASTLVGETMAGTAQLLRDRDWDTLAVRREVASPGGTTARGLAALERGGVRAAFSAAIDDVLEPR